MDWEEPKAAAKTIAVGEPLYSLGLGELEARIATFQAEIERIKVEIDRKRRLAQEASSIFGG